MSTFTAIETDGHGRTIKRFDPTPLDSPRAFKGEEWQAYWSALSEPEQQSLRDKASWEHMSLSAIAREWGAIADVGTD